MGTLGMDKVDLDEVARGNTIPLATGTKVVTARSLTLRGLRFAPPLACYARTDRPTKPDRPYPKGAPLRSAPSFRCYCTPLTPVTGGVTLY